MITYAVIGGILAALGCAVWTALRLAEARGRADAEKNWLQDGAKAARKANEIDEDVLRLSDDDLDRELYDDR